MAGRTAISTGVRQGMRSLTRDSFLLISVPFSHNLDSSPTDFTFHMRCPFSTRRVERAHTAQTVESTSLINPAGDITVTMRGVSMRSFSRLELISLSRSECTLAHLTTLPLIPLTSAPVSTKVLHHLSQQSW